MSRETETEKVPCLVINETDKAIELERKPDCVRAWFPKSQFHFERRNIKTGDAVAVIPAWLLTKKEW